MDNSDSDMGLENIVTKDNSFVRFDKGQGEF